MIILLSPAKRLKTDFDASAFVSDTPRNIEMSEVLVEKLKKLSVKKLGELMKVNDKLAEENWVRFQNWNKAFSDQNAGQAMLMFNGDAYLGLEAHTLSSDEIAFGHKHLRILSGLHGMLRGADLIMPYRLVMGTSMKVQRAKNLIDYWQHTVTDNLIEDLKQNKSSEILNVASKEYASVVDTEKIADVRVVNAEFLDNKNGTYKFIQTYGKKARGLMTRFVIQNKIDRVEDAKAFDLDGYAFNAQKSTENNWVFTRG